LRKLPTIKTTVLIVIALHFFLLVNGSISIASVFGVNEHFEKLVYRKFHPVLFGTNKGCPKSSCKAREKVKKGGGKAALLIAASYLVLAVLFQNNSVTKYRNPCTDLSNAFIANLLRLNCNGYAGSNFCLCSFATLQS
jgi:hypothetical protein